jgi:hypothetical protein
MLRRRAFLVLAAATLVVALTALVVGLAGPQAESAPAGLVAAYGFSEGAGSTFSDASGNGNGGTISGASWSAQGRFGNALSFDGSDDMATVADSASLDLTTGMTLQAWVNPVTLSSWRTIVVKEMPGNLVYGLYANSSTSRPVGEVRTSTLRAAYGTAQLPLNSWSHLATTYDGANLRFYLNGALVRTTSATGNITVSGSPLRIGATTVWGEHFRGLIDEVRIYNRALSLAEIQADMNISVDEQAGPTATPTDTPTATNTAPPTSTPTATSTPTSTNTPDPNATPTSTATFTATSTFTPTPTTAAVPTPTNTPSGSATTGEFGPVVSWPLVAVHATLLPNGNVLVWDGWETTTLARVWNPSNNNWTSVTNPVGLFCAGHSTLADGRTIVVGGHNGGEVGIKATNIFNPSTNAWTRVADMQYARWYPTSTTLPDGRVVAISGQITHGVFADTPEIYNPSTNTWTPLSGVNTGDMREPEYPLAWLLPSGNIFVAAPTQAIARVLNVSAQSWNAAPNLPLKFGSMVMYEPGKFLYTGGGTALNASAQRQAGVIDMTSGTPAWRAVQQMAYPRYDHNLVMLPDGRILAVGGATTITRLPNTTGSLPAEIFDPVTETWTTVDSAGANRLYHHTSLLLPDGRVLLAGGGRLGTGAEAMINHLTAELYSPGYLFKGARPSITGGSGSGTYGGTITINTPDAASISAVSLIPLGSNTHTIDMNGRFQRLAFTQGSGQLTATIPSNANLTPPGTYMVFILNGQGVPSAARIITIGGTPPDTQLPAVSITSPANGATVSGTVSIAANASDNVAVAGVQFQVNGVNLGAEDATAPYTASWNSTLVANGNHTITAIARDTSGNQASSSVTVNVQNSGGGGGLVLAMGFNEGSGSVANDSSGAGNNGTLNGATWSTQGRYGGALTFNGSSAYVTVPDASSLDVTTGLTMEAWVRPTELSGWRTILIKESPSSPVPRGSWSERKVWSLYAHSDGSVPRGMIVNTTQNYHATGTSALPLNTWTHLAATYDGVTFKLYVNGVLVRTTTASGTIFTSNDALRIGGNAVWGEYFKGMIDDVRVYNRALSATEVVNDMNTPLP